MDARKIPFEEEFDVIGLFDVIEHIEEDDLVLSQVNSALKSNGVVIITVPQHMCLWSAADEYACHIRRYSKYEIEQKITNAGFEILRSTSFVTLLLPALFLSRMQKSQSKILIPLRN